MSSTSVGSSVPYYATSGNYPKTEQLTAVGARPRSLRRMPDLALKGEKVQGKPPTSQQCATCVGLRVGGAGYAAAAWRVKHPPTLPPLLESTAISRAHNGSRNDDGARCRGPRVLPRATGSGRTTIARARLTYVDAFCGGSCHPSFETNRRGTGSSLRGVFPISACITEIDGRPGQTRGCTAIRKMQRHHAVLPWRDDAEIMRAISEGSAGKRDYAIVLLLASMVWAQHEVLGIRLEDCELARRSDEGSVGRRPMCDRAFLCCGSCKA